MESQTSKATAKAEAAAKAAEKLEGKYKGALTKSAKAVVGVLLAQSDVIGKAETARKDSVLAVARELHTKSKGMGVDDKGASVLHKIWIDAFGQAFMEARGEKKASDYTRRLKSNVFSILVAVNFGGGNVTFTNAEGKEEQRKVSSYADWLAEVSPTIERMATLATAIKKEHGYTSARGASAGTGVRPMNATTLSNTLTNRMKGRLGTQGVVTTLTFLKGEILGMLRPGQKPEVKAALDKAISTVLDALAQSEKDDDKQKPSSSAARQALNQATGNVAPFRRGSAKQDGEAGQGKRTRKAA